MFTRPIYPQCNRKNINGDRPCVKLRDVPMSEMNSEMNDPQLKIIQRQQQSRPRNDYRKNDNYQNYQKMKSLEEREAAYQQARARIFQDGQEEEIRQDTEHRFTRVQPRISSNEPRPRFYYTNYYPPQQPYGYPPYLNYSGDNKFSSNDGSFSPTDDGKTSFPSEMVGSPVQPVMYLPYMNTATPYGWAPNAGMLPFPADENGILYYPYPPQEIPPEPTTEPTKSVICFGSVETPLIRSEPPAFNTKSHFKPNNVIVSKTVEKKECF
jgi:hypothetical protein